MKRERRRKIRRRRLWIMRRRRRRRRCCRCKRSRRRRRRRRRTREVLGAIPLGRVRQHLLPGKGEGRLLDHLVVLIQAMGHYEFVRRRRIS